MVTKKRSGKAQRRAKCHNVPVDLSKGNIQKSVVPHVQGWDKVVLGVLLALDLMKNA